jgi:hypothetical protein
MARHAAIGVAIYLAAGVAFLITVNADQDNFAIPFFVVVAAAIVAGWITGVAGWRGLWIGVVVPWLLVLLGLPFGQSNQFTGGDDLDAVALIALAPAVASMALMPLAAGLRILDDGRRAHTSRRVA